MKFLFFLPYSFSSFSKASNCLDKWFGIRFHPFWSWEGKNSLIARWEMRCSEIHFFEKSFWKGDIRFSEGGFEIFIRNDHFNFHRMVVCRFRSHVRFGIFKESHRRSFSIQIVFWRLRDWIGRAVGTYEVPLHSEEFSPSDLCCDQWNSSEWNRTRFHFIIHDSLVVLHLSDLSALKNSRD
jgi:hypothetical protein